LKPAYELEADYASNSKAVMEGCVRTDAAAPSDMLRNNSLEAVLAFAHKTARGRTAGIPGGAILRGGRTRKAYEFTCNLRLPDISDGSRTSHNDFTKVDFSELSLDARSPRPSFRLLRH